MSRHERHDIWAMMSYVLALILVLAGMTGIMVFCWISGMNEGWLWGIGSICVAIFCGYFSYWHKLFRKALKNWRTHQTIENCLKM